MIIYAITIDDFKTFLFKEDRTFDIRLWANKNKGNFNLLGIKEIEYEMI